VAINCQGEGEGSSVVWLATVEPFISRIIGVSEALAARPSRACLQPQSAAAGEGCAGAREPGGEYAETL
jgi:hypothetical protein